MSNINTEELVETYLAIRHERDKLLSEYEAQDSVLKEDLTKIEVALLSVCNGISADSIKTSHGTVMRGLKERFYCGDWDNFYKFVLDNSAVELLERRIHQGNFKEFMKTHDGDGLPPGVNVMREFGITVRKAAAK